MRANILWWVCVFRLREEDGVPSLQSHLLRRNKKLSRRYLLCHGCGTIVAQMWHDSRTDVARSFHGCGTTYFFEEIICFLEAGICFFATLRRSTAQNRAPSTCDFATLTQGASNKVVIFLPFFVVLTLIMRLIYKIMRRFAVQTCAHARRTYANIYKFSFPN